MPLASSLCYHLINHISNSLIAAYISFKETFGAHLSSQCYKLGQKEQPSRTQNVPPLCISALGQIPRGGINGSKSMGKTNSSPMGLHQPFWHWVGPEGWYGLELPPRAHTSSPSAATALWCWPGNLPLSLCLGSRDGNRAASQTCCQDQVS